MTPGVLVVLFSMTATMTSPLTAQDRCDRCSAKAYVRVAMPVGELLFCAHHARKHADALQDVATEIHDETHRLHDEEAAER